MEQDYVSPSNNKISIEELKNDRSKQIVSSIDAFGGTIILLKILQGKNFDEFLFLKFLPDIPNNPLIDIRQEETVEIRVFRENQKLPKVFAVRDNFPIGLPHTIDEKELRPVNLCIFEERFEELKHNWSGTFFLRRIKKWLELTARNELHQDDQPLEPFVVGNGGIILNADSNFFLKKLDNNFYKSTNDASEEFIFDVRVGTIAVKSGLIRQNVNNLSELNEIFGNNGIDILANLDLQIDRITQIGFQQNLGSRFWFGKTVLNVQVPIIGNNSLTEQSIYSFKINATLGELSALFGKVILGINRIETVEKNLSKEKLSTIKLEVLNPHFNLSKKTAIILSETRTEYENLKVSLVGVGAMGSQFFMNLARSGFGVWKLIDNDILLPHNFIRHASTDIENYLAKNKAEAISKQANDLLNDSDFSKPFAISIYGIDKTILLDSDIIIDMSTSIGVERYLANEIKGIRKVSAFLNPMGTDFVMLTEDVENYFPLDILEIQYYKELLTKPELANHLDFEQDGKIRYARGCRDITSKIPQENLSIFSGIASKAFKQNLKNNNASLQIWRTDQSQSQSISHLGFKVEDWQEKSIYGWTVYINENHFLNTVSKFRADKLPNETGGILIGAIDNYYKKIYIVHTILAPEDSIERPTLFIRGIKGVSKTLDKINNITNDNLKYLGEWHSHPKNCGLGMSGDDKIQFAELLNEAKFNGQPAIMLILGDDNNFKIYLDNCEL